MDNKANRPPEGQGDKAAREAAILASVGSEQGAGEDIQKAVAEAEAQLIKPVIKMYESMGQEPDLAHIWESEAFQLLPEAAQRALRAKYEAAADRSADGGGEVETKETSEGVLAPEQNEPVEPAEGPELGRRIEGGESVEPIGALKRRLDEIKAEAGGGRPNYSDVWKSAGFRALREEVRDGLRFEYGDPLKRQFREYALQLDEGSGQYEILDRFEELNKARDAYVDKTSITAIEAPTGIAEQLGKDQEATQEFLEFCSSVRRELDEQGVKIYLDPIRGSDIAGRKGIIERDWRDGDDEGKYSLVKWKYYLDSKPHDSDLLDIDSLPSRIVELIKADSRYFNKPEWRRWFGPMMQRKREEIITRQAAEEYGHAAEESAVTEEAVEAEDPKRVPVREEEQAKEYPRDLLARDSLRIVKLQAKIWESLYDQEDPEQRRDFDQRVMEASSAYVEEMGRKQGYTAEKENIAETVRDAIRENKLFSDFEVRIHAALRGSVGDALNEDVAQKMAEALAHTLVSGEKVETLVYDKATGEVGLKDDAKFRDSMRRIYARLTGKG